MIADLKLWAIVGLSAFCVFLGVSTWSYRTLYKSTDKALQTQNKAIEAQNNQAQEKFKLLKANADRLQGEKNTLAVQLEKDGEKGTVQISADSKRDTAPVVVRYVTRYARSCGGGSSGGPTALAEAGAGPAGEASGILAPEVAELFRRDQDGVEQLQLAFNLCKRHGR